MLEEVHVGANTCRACIRTCTNAGKYLGNYLGIGFVPGANSKILKITAEIGETTFGGTECQPLRAAIRAAIFLAVNALARRPFPVAFRHVGRCLDNWSSVRRPCPAAYRRESTFWSSTLLLSGGVSSCLQMCIKMFGYFTLRDDENIT